jgi:Zn-dependent protease
MIDLLLIISTVVLLILAQFLRMILAHRIPESLQYKSIVLAQPPDVVQDLFTQADRALMNLGFSAGYWASVQTQPPLPGMHAPLVRLYHHPQKPVIARVHPPHSVFSTDRCQVVFLSISQKKRILVTANRMLELFPRPPKDRVVVINAEDDSVSEQFQVHCQEMQRLAIEWQDNAREHGEKRWTFKLANYYEKKIIRWYLRNQYIKRQADGSATPTLRVAVRFIMRFFTGREQNPPREFSPLPVDRAAYLFHNWQLANSLPPPLTTQLGIFLFSSILFMLIGGLFWEWQTAPLLLGVILFHEFGHWLAMRMLGYRNLQILMLPLIGGVTFGQETTYKASHRVIVSLMGPFPGIILGTALLAFNGMQGETLPLLAILLLAVNYLNLLPFMPLDGGQLLKTLISHKRFGLMIALEWLGVAGLLLLGWMSNSLLLASLALLPLFGSLKLMRKSRIYQNLNRLDQESNITQDERLVASVIQVMDQTAKSYRPLKKKAAEIREIMSTLKLERPAPAIIGLLLGSYLALFLVPPVVAYSTSSALRLYTQRLYTQTLFHGIDEIQQAETAHEEEHSQTTSELLAELGSEFSSLDQPDQQMPPHRLLLKPASEADILAAEQRLQTRFESDYRQLLMTSNGVNTFWQDPTADHYMLLPIEQVSRFGAELNRIKDSMTEAKAPVAHVSLEPSNGNYQEMSFDYEQLGSMLLIGRQTDMEYLLLDQSTDGMPAQVIQIYKSISGLGGSRYANLKSYLTVQLSHLKVAAP